MQKRRLSNSSRWVLPSFFNFRIFFTRTAAFRQRRSGKVCHACQTLSHKRSKRSTGSRGKSNQRPWHKSPRNCWKLWTWRNYRSSSTKFTIFGEFLTKLWWGAWSRGTSCFLSETQCFRRLRRTADRIVAVETKVWIEPLKPRNVIQFNLWILIY